MEVKVNTENVDSAMSDASLEPNIFIVAEGDLSIGILTEYIDLSHWIRSYRYVENESVSCEAACYALNDPQRGSYS